MKYSYKNLKDVPLIEPDIFYDHRGEYVETFNSEYYKVFGDIEWKQDSFSTSVKNTLRGLHGDSKTWKLIQCLKGSIILAVVDMRENSSTYLKHDLFYLNEKNRHQVLVPPMFANGHYVIEDCIFSYKQSTLYTGAQNQFTVRWDDPELNIFWPNQSPILSSRDKNANFLNLKNI
jgi:dTDP-4-dehydrorhamnose 3,5-epimerase